MRTMTAAQQGVGMSSILFYIVLIIFVLTVVFKLGPDYASYWTLRSIMNSIAESPEPILGGRPAVLRLVDNRLMVNEVRWIDAKAFTVTKVGEDAFDLSVAYERREHLFFNVDAVLKFNHSVVVKGR